MWSSQNGRSYLVVLGVLCAVTHSVIAIDTSVKTTEETSKQVIQETSSQTTSVSSVNRAKANNVETTTVNSSSDPLDSTNIPTSSSQHNSKESDSSNTTSSYSYSISTKRESTESPTSDIHGGSTERESTESQTADIHGGSTERESTESPISDIHGGSTERESTESQTADIHGGSTERESTESPISDIHGGSTERESTESQTADIHGGSTERESTESPTADIHRGSTEAYTTKPQTANASQGTTNAPATNDSPGNSDSVTEENPTSHIATSPVPTKLPLVTLKLNSQLKYEVNYTKELDNTTSDLFKQKKTYYTNLLTEAYNSTYPLAKVTVHNFWEGSLVVNYTVTIQVNFSVDSFKQELEKVYAHLLTTPGVNETFLNQSHSQSLEQALEHFTGVCSGDSNVCPQGFACTVDDNTGPVCLFLCSSEDSNKQCHNGGYCVRESQHEFFCRCPDDDTFLYGGQYCEVKAEKLDLSKTHIIGIAAGSGGALVILFVIIIIFVYQRKKSKEKLSKDKTQDNASEESFKSIKDSEDGLHHSFTGQRNASPLDYNNPTFRLPTAKLDNRTENPYAIVQRRQTAGAADPLNLSVVFSKHHSSAVLQDGRVGESSQSRPDSHRSLNREQTAPNQGLSIQYQNFQQALPTSDYQEIEDNFSKSVIYQPTRATRPLLEFQGAVQPLETEAKVYDYTRRTESVGSSSHNQGGLNFYDFDYENSGGARIRNDDPYAVRKPRGTTQKKF